jgi:hypothetical protein
MGLLGRGIGPLQDPCLHKNTTTGISASSAIRTHDHGVRVVKAYSLFNAIPICCSQNNNQPVSCLTTYVSTVFSTNRNSTVNFCLNWRQNYATASASRRYKNKARCINRRKWELPVDILTKYKLKERKYRLWMSICLWEITKVLLLKNHFPCYIHETWQTQSFEEKMKRL